MPQTTQTAAPPIARRGLLYGAQGNPVIRGDKIASASLIGGQFVARDAADGKVKLPTTANEVQLTGVGFVVYDAAHTVPDGSAFDYAAGDAVPVLEHGDIWVQSEEALAYGDPVFVRFASGGGGSVLGLVRNDADTATAAELVNARVLKTTAAAGLVLIRVDSLVN